MQSRPRRGARPVAPPATPADHSPTHPGVPISQLDGARLERARFDGARLCGASLRGAALAGVDLSRAILSEEDADADAEPAALGAVVALLPESIVHLPERWRASVRDVFGVTGEAAWVDEEDDGFDGSLDV